MLTGNAITSGVPDNTIGIAIKIPINASPVINPAANSMPWRMLRYRSAGAGSRRRNHAINPPRKIGVESSSGQIDADGDGENRTRHAAPVASSYSSTPMIAAPISSAEADHLPRQPAAEHALATDAISVA